MEAVKFQEDIRTRNEFRSLFRSRGYCFVIRLPPREARLASKTTAKRIAVNSERSHHFAWMFQAAIFVRKSLRNLGVWQRIVAQRRGEVYFIQGSKSLSLPRREILAARHRALRSNLLRKISAPLRLRASSFPCSSLAGNSEESKFGCGLAAPCLCASSVSLILTAGNSRSRNLVRLCRAGSNPEVKLRLSAECSRRCSPACGSAVNLIKVPSGLDLPDSPQLAPSLELQRGHPTYFKNSSVNSLWLQKPNACRPPAGMRAVKASRMGNWR
jgi:hypothetical protein